ncbi:MAG: efflux RND transporter permease subunit [Verrucomicrobiae bacterium]|nr:efflux RND transporter permease subunit [Verrucomicrobiae bacterium]
MLKGIIDFSLKNKFIVLLGALALVVGGVYSVKNIPVDAIPDLSDVQVIIYTEYPGQAPQIVQDQVTYPITTKMLSVPFKKVVRGYSFYGYSFVYVIFEDGTDPYWARSRVLEYLSQLSTQMPKGVTPSLGPDATGVGWAFMYAINSTNHSLQELRSMQDWHLRYQLTAVDGVSEVASIGGFEKQYQVTVDPVKLRAYDLPLSKVRMAIEMSNGEVGGRAIEMAEKEFIVRVKGYIQDVESLRKVAVGVGPNGVPILLRDVATVQLGPEMRRGIAELNGEGETVGGIVVVRYGANARKVIQEVKEKLDAAMKALPSDVTYTIAYDRSALIDRSVKTLQHTLLEESVVVALVIIVFLLHFRTALVPIVILPIAVLVSILIMHVQGISMNIMSLGGIAIAIGVLVDGVIILVENVHKHSERDEGRKPRWEIVRDASVEVGPTIFFALLVVTVSFLPVFTLQEQSGRMFKPLAFTKTYSMAAAAILAITLAPVLAGLFIRGRAPAEEKNPISRFLTWIYHPVIDFVIKWRWSVITAAVVVVVWVFFPWNWLVTNRLPEGQTREFSQKLGKLFPYQNIGSEFMPPLHEGDLLYMPTTFPGISSTKARELLQQTDKIIKTFPEVHHVFGKVGRAETATDPAPFDMIETTVMLRDEKDWPKVDIKDDSGKVVADRRRTVEELVDALNSAIQFPGLANAWTMPIKTRIDMLSTGIKTPVGIKIAGPNLAELERIGSEVEAVVKQVPGTTSAYSERVIGGRYLEFDINRDEIARYGLTLGEVQEVLAVALGGMPITTTVEGLERYTINLRYERDYRQDLQALRDLIVPAPTGAQVPMGQLATIKVVNAAMAIKSEAAVPNAWIYVDVKGIDIGTYVQAAMRTVNQAIADGTITLPEGYSIFWSGQYEYMLRAKERLLLVVPVTLLIVALLIYLSTRSFVKTGIVLLAVPFSVVGAFWLIYLLDYNMSVAVWIGLIALAGLDAETGMVMLLYLDIAYEKWQKEGRMRNGADLRDAIYHGAVKRLRPKVMTVATTFIALVPIMWSTGTGADVMKRIAVPMIGGVATSLLMELLVYPAIFYIWRSRTIRHQNQLPPAAATSAQPEPAH